MFKFGRRENSTPTYDDEKVARVKLLAEQVDRGLAAASSGLENEVDKAFYEQSGPRYIETARAEVASDYMVFGDTINQLVDLGYDPQLIGDRLISEFWNFGNFHPIKTGDFRGGKSKELDKIADAIVDIAANYVGGLQLSADLHKTESHALEEYRGVLRKLKTEFQGIIDEILEEKARQIIKGK